MGLANYEFSANFFNYLLSYLSSPSTSSSSFLGPLPLKVLKNKIQPSEFEDLIGFIKQFMIWAVSHLATRMVLQGVEYNGRLL